MEKDEADKMQVDEAQRRLGSKPNRDENEPNTAEARREVPEAPGVSPEEPRTPKFGPVDQEDEDEIPLLGAENEVPDLCAESEDEFEDVAMAQEDPLEKEKFEAEDDEREEPSGKRQRLGAIGVDVTPPSRGRQHGKCGGGQHGEFSKNFPSQPQLPKWQNGPRIVSPDDPPAEVWGAVMRPH